MDTNEIATGYARTGYWIIPAMLSAEECETLKTEGLRVLCGHAPAGASVHVGPSVASQVFRQLADDPRVVGVLRVIMPDGVEFLSDKLVFKSAAHREATPWHTDAFYWPGTRPKLSVWIPLDDVTAANGALIVVPGSHHKNWQPAKDPGDKKEFRMQIDREGNWDQTDEIICEIPRGSAIFFSDQLLHASCPNDSGADRYSIISTYHAPGEEPFDQNFTARHIIIGGIPG